MVHLVMIEDVMIPVNVEEVEAEIVIIEEE
jgi:hypothetical protein